MESVDYKITYTGHRNEDRIVLCNNYEDAEKIAAFIAECIPAVRNVVLTDGTFNVSYPTDYDKVNSN